MDSSIVQAAAPAGRWRRAYGIFGFAVGCAIALTVLGATIIRSGGGWSPAHLLAIHRHQPLLWLAYTLPICMALLAHDEGRRRHMAAQIRAQRDFYQRILDSIGDGITVSGSDGGFTFVNAAAARMIGLPTAELRAKPPRDLFVPEDAAVRAALLDDLRARRAGEYECRLRHRSGETIHVRIHAMPFSSADGAPGTVTVVSDQTQRVTLERELNRERDFNTTVLDTMQGLLIVLDQGGRIVRLNRACETLTGYHTADLRGSSFWDALLPEEDRPAVAAVFAGIASSGQIQDFEHHWRTVDGDLRLICWSTAAVYADDGGIAYIVGSGLDVTEISLIEEQREIMLEDLHQLATTDSLTGLANRGYFLNQASQSLQRAQASGAPISALLLDVDYFKRINDTYGHAAGDQVLLAVAQRCRAALRTGDLIGRYGGEEFAVILPATEAAAAQAIAERLRAAVAGIALPVGAETLGVTISVGVAGRAGEQGLAALLGAADDALYAAKDRGRNRVVLGATPRPAS